QDAAALAGALARATGADAILVGVLSDPVVIPLTGVSWKELREQAKVALAETRDSYVPGARPVIVNDISVARALERVVAEEHVDLLVVGSSTDAPDGRIRIGRRTRQLIGDAGCALAIAPRGLRNQHELSLARIGVGYDGSPESHAALEFGGTIARAAGAEMCV